MKNPYLQHKVYESVYEKKLDEERQQHQQLANKLSRSLYDKNVHPADLNATQAPLAVNPLMNNTQNPLVPNSMMTKPNPLAAASNHGSMGDNYWDRKLA